MSEEHPSGDEAAGGPAPERGWKVDRAKTLSRLLRRGGQRGQGGVVYVDEQGRQRRLPADVGALTPEERNAALGALSSALGSPEPADARAAALERLAELRASGAVSQEDYERERRRLAGWG